MFRAAAKFLILCDVEDGGWENALRIARAGRHGLMRMFEGACIDQARFGIVHYMYAYVYIIHGDTKLEESV
jgi:hypothetical protein